MLMVILQWINNVGVYLWKEALACEVALLYCTCTMFSPSVNVLKLAKLNPLTPGAFLPKMRFLDILVVLRLDLGQISFNLVENAFATRQLALLATSITFHNILAWACAEIKILRF